MLSHSQDPDISALEERFSALLGQLGLEAEADRVFGLLSGYYAERGRHYHRLGHVQQCLKVVDEVHDMLDDPTAVELAIWFHDAVFDPDRRDNELRSALLFDRHLGVSLPTGRADLIHGMIMTTIHPSQAVQHDAQFVADIDISGLALPWTDFYEDTKALRREDAHLPEERFRAGKLKFFKQLLARSSIYLTDYFQEHYDSAARQNLLTLCRQLEDNTGESIPTS